MKESLHHLLDGGFDREARQEVGEIPAMLCVSTGPSYRGRIRGQLDDTTVVLYFLYPRSQILTHFQLCTHGENTDKPDY